MVLKRQELPILGKYSGDRLGNEIAKFVHSKLVSRQFGWSEQSHSVIKKLSIPFNSIANGVPAETPAFKYWFQVECKYDWIAVKRLLTVVDIQSRP